MSKGYATLPRDTRQLIDDLTERRTHSGTMQFTAEDAEQLAGWEAYIEEISI